MKIKKGFTLVELLVVVTIVAILVALIFPIFANARRRSREATCQNGMKKVAVSFMMYVAKYDDQAPPEGVNPSIAVFDSHMREDAKTFTCPELKKETTYDGSELRLGYAWNPQLSGTRPSFWSDACELVVMFSEYDDLGALLPVSVGEDGEEEVLDVLKLSYRHGMSTNVAWMDGHCRGVNRDKTDQFAMLLTPVLAKEGDVPTDHLIFVNGIAYAPLNDDSTNAVEDPATFAELESLAGISLKVRDGEAHIEQLPVVAESPD